MTKLAFLGAGNIAQAIIGGLIATGFNPDDICAADPSDEQLTKLRKIGVRTSSENLEAITAAEVVILSIKPDVVEQISREISPMTSGKLFISVAAGITATSLESWLQSDTVIRCMPNTPALVMKGMTGLYATSAVSSEQREIADTILSAVGETLWFEEESKLDAVTAVSGSGPAYFFYVIEVMQEAALAVGLSPEESSKLVLQTARGAAEMALQSVEPVAELRRKVTSPGGTTAAALEVLQQEGLDGIFLQAVMAAKKRSEGLSNI
jgi:pyrroline-5-carboxylate reductase